MTFGEDRNKLQNIVLPHVDTFREMYDHSIQELSNVLCINGGRLQQVTMGTQIYTALYTM